MTYRETGKRTVDIVVGSLVALVALPVIVLVAGVSAIVFRAWPIFGQTRIGRFGRSFTCVKIRSMPSSAPEAVDKYAAARLDIPWWGRFIRRTHLDELPQLWLVPLGRMSLVGPRPEMMELSDRYSPAFLDARLSVRPGCTGLWQISRAVEEMIYEAPEYDFAYVANVGFRLDLWVLARSLATALQLRPTIDSLAQVPHPLLRHEVSAVPIKVAEEVA